MAGEGVDRMTEHYVCPICGCADMRHTAAMEKALYQAEERGIQEGLDLRDDLREQLAGSVHALARIAAGPHDGPYSEPWSRAEALIALDRMGVTATRHHPGGQS